MDINLNSFYENIEKKFGSEIEEVRLITILIFTLGLGQIVLFIMGTCAIISGYKTLAYADYTALIILFLIQLYFYISKKLKETILLGVSFTALFFFFLFIYGGVNKTGFIWLYTFPLYSCFSLGSKKGVLLSLSLALLAIIYFVFDDFFPLMSQYGDDLKLRFIFSYLIVSLFSFAGEFLREGGQRSLQETQKILEQKVVERTIKLTEKNLELEIASTTDSLTGVYNRLKLDHVLSYEVQQALRYQGDLSLIIIDIDYFKRVNDEFGHVAGDKVLVHFSELIVANIRSVDSFGRWGGEEFLLICPSISQLNALKLAEKIRLCIQEHGFEDIGNLTASFGIASYHQGVNEITLIKQADEALYKAKKSRNACILHREACLDRQDKTFWKSSSNRNAK